ncbi:MAG TPA: phosphoenolpyruvate carboxylase, partial [Anaeromyxobacteraceae bacterium]|nr:phosphoenolpyruvate carboxylase [Anaeromyxobacteraceae bacterium]
MTSAREPAPGTERLDREIRTLGDLLGDAIARIDGPEAFARVDGLRASAMALRRGELAGGRDELERRMAGLGPGALAQVANAFTDLFHLVNAAEEQHRVRVLRARDRAQAPIAGSIASACAELRRSGVTADQMRALLDRLLVMPVVTAHPTEARRRAVLDHLEEISRLLDALDDPRVGARGAGELRARLAEAVTGLAATAKARRRRPTPIDEVKAGLEVFERSLLDATPSVYRALEDALAATWPGERFEVGCFLRFGSWIGGDRDGNPFVTAEVTRAALERHRAVVLRRYREDVAALWRALSVSEARVGPSEGAARALERLR